MRFWQMLFSVALTLAAGTGLLALSGQARAVFAPPLRAELVLDTFRLPPGFGLDPERVAAFLSDELKRRLAEDVGIRMTLKPEVAKKIHDIVLPRLMNVVAVQSMLRELPEVSAMLDLGHFRRSLHGRIVSTVAAQDVALTVPGALLAYVDGKAVSIITTSTGMSALELGPMAAGQERQVTLWLGGDGAEPEPDLRLGAAGGLRGRVLLWGGQGWFGADMAAMRWSRWLVGALLSGVALFGLAGLLLPFLRRA